MRALRRLSFAAALLATTLPALAAKSAKPEFGSVWIHMSGPAQAQARLHVTVAVPGATTQSMGLPDNASKCGRKYRNSFIIWICRSRSSMPMWT